MSRKYLNLMVVGGLVLAATLLPCSSALLAVQAPCPMSGCEEGSSMATRPETCCCVAEAAPTDSNTAATFGTKALATEASPACAGLSTGFEPQACGKLDDGPEPPAPVPLFILHSAFLS